VLQPRPVPVYRAINDPSMSAEDMIILPEYILYCVDGVNDLPYVDLAEFTVLMILLDQASRKEEYGEDAEIRTEPVH